MIELDTTLGDLYGSIVDHETGNIHRNFVQFLKCTQGARCMLSIFSGGDRNTAGIGEARG